MFVRCWGSSPLTRGKPGWQSFCHVNYGLIPAHAGKTRRAATTPGITQAHPRSRGENDPGSTQPERLMGSSPLTRGKPTSASRPLLGHGLIPAHAGKTHDRHGVLACEGAHPRSRGEND